MHINITLCVLQIRLFLIICRLDYDGTSISSSKKVISLGLPMKKKVALSRTT